MECLSWAVPAAARRQGGAAVQAVRRAWTEPGRERDLTVQAGKATVAACLAWAVAGWWLRAPAAFVAPWVAVVLVESTVYRSLTHGLQQLAAITVGTVMATLVAFTLDSTMIAMAVVLPAVLLLAHWQRLGSQGIYAATGALFVLTSSQVTFVTSTARIGEAVFGALVGITVNAVIRPPVYLRDARAALRDAAWEAQEILSAVAEGLAQGEWDESSAGDWHTRALRLGRLVEQARSAIGWSRESMRGNHRGRGSRGVSLPDEAYADALAVLDHVAVHIAGVTRTVLEMAGQHGETDRPGQHVTGPYAGFLRQVGRAIGLYGQARFPETGSETVTQAAREQAAEELRHSLDELHRKLSDTVRNDSSALATHGELLAQARRLAYQLVQDQPR
ncbi:aromatic acid exporter family protein [Streptomyces sp. NPDC015171]|uniref:FUSC family protein n=1 Tax=Streptomyces sp. NPDC015171 TaxID=3364945 RepID=UPI0036FA385E